MFFSVHPFKGRNVVQAGSTHVPCCPGFSVRSKFGRHFSAAFVFFTLASYALVAYGLVQSNGMYHPPALFSVGLGWLALCFAALCFRSSDGLLQVSVRWLWILLAVAFFFLLYLNRSVDPGIYLRDPSYVARFKEASLWIGSFTLLSLTLSMHRWLRFLCNGFSIVSFVLFGALYLGMLCASPSPVIDVFTMLRDSSQALLHWHNPYTTPFQDPYGGAQGLPWTKADVLVYPPTVLVPSIASTLVAGDVRFFSVLSVLFVGLVIWWIARRRDEVIGQLLCLLWLVHPRGLFVIEQSWVDPLALATIACSFLLLRGKALRLVASCFGCFVSLKHYLVLSILPALRVARSWRIFLWFVIPPAAIALPFFLWSPRAFLDNAVLFQLKASFRSDSLTLAAFLFSHYGVVLGKWWALGVGLVSSGVAFLLPQGRSAATLAFSMAFIFLTFFVLGSQGFCNYYYFTSGLTLMALALMIGESRSTHVPSIVVPALVGE